MENISYMVLEEQNNSQEDSCVIIDERNYCVSKEATSMGDGSKLSIGDSYDVSGVSEKNLLLVFWLSNLNINQNSIDVGTYNATVTILAGNGGEIKGTIANAVQINQGDSQEPSTDNTDTP